MFFDADGWAHLSRYLDEAAADGRALDRRVGERVEALLSAASLERRAAIPLRRRVIYELLGEGESALALRCHAARVADPWSADVFADVWLEASALLERKGRIDAVTRARIAVDEVFAALADTWIQAGLLPHGRAIERVLSALDDTAMAELSSARKNANLTRIALALRSGDAGAADDLLGVMASVVVVDEVGDARRHVRVGVSSDLPVEFDGCSVVARRSDGGVEVVVGHLVAGSGRASGWRAHLNTTDLTEGDWHLWARVRQDELGALSIPFNAGRRGAAVPDTRFTRVIVLPRKQVGDRIVIRARPTMARRVVRKGRRAIAWLASR
jgi:hypothetical protein